MQNGIEFNSRVSSLHPSALRQGRGYFSRTNFFAAYEASISQTRRKSCQELSPNFGEGRSRSGTGGHELTVVGLAMTSMPSLNVTARTSFDNWLWPSRRRQLFCAASSSLKTIASAVPVGQATLRSDRAVAHGSEGAFNGIGRPQVFPVLGREVVERQ